MRARLCLALLVAVLPASALAQVKVKTQTIRPPAAAVTPPGNQFIAPAAGEVEPAAASQRTADGLEIVTDPARLPPQVLRTRESILAAARSGDLEKLAAVIRKSGTKPVFSY